VPKEDYDFESANAKFNKQELVKEAIASGSPNPLGSPTANGDSDSLAATAGAVNGHANIDGEKEGDESVVIPPAERGYDKQSSFFDNISSDLKDRTEQVQDGSGVTFDGRAMRTQERSKNMETFGQSNVDGGGYRGGYRGRGRGYGYNPNYRGRGYRGRGGYERGGYRGRGRGGAEGETAAPIAS
jgi:protein LSM14